jgi:hypothetical protein
MRALAISATQSLGGEAEIGTSTRRARRSRSVTQHYSLCSLLDDYGGVEVDGETFITGSGVADAVRALEVE